MNAIWTTNSDLESSGSHVANRRKSDFWDYSNSLALGAPKAKELL
jgi:hypothetical protein